MPARRATLVRKSKNRMKEENPKNMKHIINLYQNKMFNMMEVKMMTSNLKKVINPLNRTSLKKLRVLKLKKQMMR